MTNNTQSKTRKIQIYDTSLRDGMQGMQINYTLEDKLSIAKELDTFKIDYIEGGFPLSNEKEAEFFKTVHKLNLSHSKIVAFGSTRRPNSAVAEDIHVRALLEAETPVITIVAKSSTSHVTEVLRTSLDENLRMTFDSIEFLKKHGREVILDLEHFFDGYKLNLEYALKMLKTGTDAGADALVLCDTNGGTLTHEVTQIMNSLPQQSLAPLGVHFHNDCELAVANSLEGIFQGAMQVQGTVNGWGERAGNANLVSVIPNLVLKDERFSAACESEMPHLTTLSRFVSDKANIIPDPRQPYVGSAAYSHKAGQHTDVIYKNDTLMEHLSPEKVGNERRILLSELAGKSTIIDKLSKYGSFTKQDIIVENLIEILKEKELYGYEYEASEASFELEIIKQLNEYEPLFQLKNYHIELYKSSLDNTKTVCRIFLFFHDQELMGTAVGNGPVHTIDLAIRDAIADKYPHISRIKLSDYRVRVLNPEYGASARVRVLISSSSPEHDWSTIGVHENIVEASWLALKDSYEYFANIIDKQ